MIQTLFLPVYSAIFLLEGLALKNGREISILLLLLFPSILFFELLITKKRVFVPLKMAVLFTIFLSFSFISTVFSVDIKASFPYFLHYLSLFLVFIVAFNYKKSLKKPIIVSFFVFSFIFSIYSLLLPFLLKTFPFLIPYSSYNFVTAGTRSHSQLGNFLVLPIVISFYSIFSKGETFLKGKREKRLLFLATIFFTPFLVFSYSRTAYLALILSFVIITLYLIKKRQFKVRSFYLVFFAIVMLTIVVLSIATVSEAKKLPLISSINKALSSQFDLKDKRLLAYRQEFFLQATLAIFDRPWFGWGPQNFGYASNKYNVIGGGGVASSHNLFLDIFAENGLLAGLAFLLIILMIFKSSKFDILKVSFLGIFLVFQTDYTYKIYSFFLLFFILAGLIYEEKKVKIKSRLPLALSAILLILVNLILMSKIFLKNKKYQLAFYLNPLSSEVYIPLIEYEMGRGNYSKGFFYLDLYEKVSKGDAQILNYIGETYLRSKEKERALDKFKKAYFWDPFGWDRQTEEAFYRKIYYLEKKLHGEKMAKEFANSHLTMGDRMKIETNLKKAIDKETEAFCREVYQKCPYRYE